MKTNAICILLAVIVFGCSLSSTSDKNEFKILTEAFRAGHLTVVSSLLKETKHRREFTEEEGILYTKTLFYLGEWKEFFSFWSQLERKTPELVLLYFKAVLISNERVSVLKEEETKLLELVPLSPEACLLYLKIHQERLPKKQKKLFLAQRKQFQTLIDRLDKELGESK
ncbi:hypothetical protein JWG41_06275 [Leptospira sp. 201903075]|uniref:hypothetical protein n=1 Tax=Leptospira chreensis TaxID=2810035 RepID=UPI0019661B36|nr:hypothetical protein [Leptospira chreensis]MBM9590043.1 hypothetical protein [Leptospira chreensis]